MIYKSQILKKQRVSSQEKHNELLWGRLIGPGPYSEQKTPLLTAPCWGGGEGGGDSTWEKSREGSLRKATVWIRTLFLKGQAAFQQSQKLKILEIPHSHHLDNLLFIFLFSFWSIFIYRHAFWIVIYFLFPKLTWSSVSSFSSIQ